MDASRGSGGGSSLSSQLSLTFERSESAVSPLSRARCSHCGRPIDVPAWLASEGLKLHFCDDRCRTRWKQSSGDDVDLRGRDAFRGGDWARQAARARRRDGYRCRQCGVSEEKLGRQLDVHHVVPFRLFPSSREANRLTNLTSLCPSCHKSRELDGHSRYPLFGNGESCRPW